MTILRTFCFSTLATLLFAFQVEARRVEFAVSPSLFRSVGQTEYIIDLTTRAEEPTGGYTPARVRSQLEFPLDVVSVGLDLNLRPCDDTQLWSLEAGGSFSVSDPHDLMFDSDWIGVTDYIDFTQFSYTESPAELKSYTLSIVGTWKVIRTGQFETLALAGFRYQKITQDIIGYRGWQRAFDEENLELGDRRTVAGRRISLEYEIEFNQPLVGIRSSLGTGSRFSIHGSAAYTRFSYSDVDDHLLRSKLSTSSGHGNGLLADLAVRLTLKEGRAPRNPYVELMFRWETLSGDGAQSQYWYDDEGYVDPITGEFIVTVPKGTSIRGIPHEVNFDQLSVRLRLGIRF